MALRQVLQRTAAPMAMRLALRPLSTSASLFAKRYTESHEWVEVSGNIVTVGISDYAQSALGDIVFVDLPEIGDDKDIGEDAAAVESVKAASEIYAPVAGSIAEVNEALRDQASLINEAAESEGWIFKLEAEDLAAVDSFMTKEQYDKYLESGEL
ncbi:uncharacterized protein MONBRDRAFT_38480 [Monosiga brevicollis MX1]|uniref:Glycine cleavage system H protein n=1 Tax=Monosiga brevicollis TaxID=81824 RepID=A9V830_MONBE|nr:uncharacterized protein MONBRDRAFT_38480 [Monosiga brevicollis MX1]EDQ86198.1 predicted protein [Monosiga brevicollis MX1]|eukprot:XP_001748868.1 hypothetical protein [Monosiga brevicollis MX1]